MRGSKGLLLVRACAIAIVTVVLVSGVACKEKTTTQKQYRGLLGADSDKVKIDGSKTFLWAGGDRSGPDAQWYDFTGSPIPTEKLQFGIGKDRIQSIDDPLFVAPDDPRLLEITSSYYGRDPLPKTNDEIMVMGYVENDVARAYPTALLDHHELVNDTIGGKPVTVGW